MGLRKLLDISTPVPFQKSWSSPLPLGGLDRLPLVPIKSSLISENGIGDSRESTGEGVDLNINATINTDFSVYLYLFFT